ncbi:hypothetical protein SAICODRAFT_16435 [Saitoella complicata NRRL Y-17804]|nr:uncharacterized protein SAICODRAFT_16435 [Saitoella complicata NRRL Y-17804]ODQ56435.1 hypothetical protein SAICODRAFT_16435 [Saitoella complicata NRRL Y-17804]
MATSAAPIGAVLDRALSGANRDTIPTADSSSGSSSSSAVEIEESVQTLQNELYEQRSLKSLYRDELGDLRTLNQSLTDQLASAQAELSKYRQIQEEWEGLVESIAHRAEMEEMGMEGAPGGGWKAKGEEDWRVEAEMWAGRYRGLVKEVKEFGKKWDSVEQP